MSHIYVVGEDIAQAHKARECRMSVAVVGALSSLEECGDALAVYQRTLNKHHHRATAATVDIDYFRRKHTCAQGLKTGKNEKEKAAFVMASQEIVFEKLRQDSHWLDQLIQRTKLSLSAEGNFEVLKNEVMEKMSTRATEEELLSKATRMKKKLEEMREEVSKEREKRRKEEENLSAELLRLRNEKEKLEVKSKAESEYVIKWLESRREQQQLKGEITRAQLRKDLQRCRIREENERLVTSRIDAYHRQSIEANEKMASEWLARRRTESKSYETEILRLRDEMNRRRATLKELQQKYNQRQEFIDTSLAEREAARKAREYEAFKLKWILKIQAAYRGMQVRRKLGPYRPEDKKKKRPPKPKK